jgi:osmotically-inducible protein OsmY
MKTDAQIQQDVIEQIKWNPQLNAAEVGVAVKNGVVTLSGQVGSYLKKTEIEKEARKVAGVRAIAEDIQVGLSAPDQRTDADIAQVIIQALNWHAGIPEETVKVKVEDGWVILEGELEWEYQRELVRARVTNLVGVRKIINNITLKQKITPVDVAEKINAAFLRSATVDAGKIQPEVEGTRLTLKGTVRSFAEKEDAGQAAWSLPGILQVDNQLEIELAEAPQYSF